MILKSRTRFFDCVVAAQSKKPLIVASPQQRHTAGQLIDLLFGAADGKAEIVKTIFGSLCHPFRKFGVGLAALR